MCTFMWLLGEYQSTISIHRADIFSHVGRLKCRWAHLKRQWTCAFHTIWCASILYPVLLQLILLSCIQQASINTQVNSSTSTRWQHVCVLLLLARGRHCYAEGGYMLGNAVMAGSPKVTTEKLLSVKCCCSCRQWYPEVRPRLVAAAAH